MEEQSRNFKMTKEMKSARGGKGGQSELPETVAGANGQEERFTLHFIIVQSLKLKWLNFWQQ